MPRDGEPAPQAQAQAQAQLCIGQVWHKRLRPRSSEFSYGTYFLRLPLRSMQDQGFSTWLCRRNRFGPLSFFDRDHGDGGGALLAWIDQFLRAEGIADADGEIWLQTMPRVFGFVFNPVSFWFCHHRDGRLRAVLCDVRNTFGERHFYLLEHADGIENHTRLNARKVFHVSPFCQVKGSYSFRFGRTWQQRDDRAYEVTLARIDYDDGAGALLQTSISGAALPLRGDTVRAVLLRFPLMTLLVVWRIHWQALRLWLRRVPFYTKPAPPDQKVSR